MTNNKLTPGSNLLWESSRMMLPEHVTELKKYQQKKKEFHPPELDSNALEEINRTIQAAFYEGKEVTIIYAKKYGPAEITGRIKKVDPHRREVMFLNGDEVITVLFGEILSAE